VQKLVEAEGSAKSARLDTAEAKAQARLSAFGTLRSALAGFSDAVAKLANVDAFRGKGVTVSDEDFLSATAGPSASPTSYAIEVDRLATAHKLRSATPFASATTPIGTGTLGIVTGGVTYNVTIDGTNNSVQGIADAINASDAGDRVIASVITTANGAATLTLTSRSTGAANAIGVTQSGGDGGLAALAYPGGASFTEAQQALDARVLIDGLEITSATNSISGVIAGVELNLIKANEDGETTTLSVGYDQAAGQKAIEDFAKSYNSVVDAIKSVAGYDVNTKKGGPLFGDAGLRNLVFQMRRELGAVVQDADTNMDMLSKIGLTMGLDGQMSVDGTKLGAALNTDFDAVGELFGAPEVGMAAKLDKLLDPYLQTGGVFDNRDASVKSSIADIDEQREALSTRLQGLQQRYLRQFNALDGLLAQLNSTSNFLAQQLSQLPGAVFNNN
jgi:flagellar hook-associated protein 2